MKKLRRSLPVFVATLLLCSWLSAQQAALSASTTAVVPRLVNYSGKATDAQGKAIAGAAGITFAIYSEQNGGSPLWLETQNVPLDSRGGYTAQLGATKPEGLPLDLFTQAQARWLGVRINGGEEQPRVLLLSVPYALKAADAETVGGLPASAFMLAAPGAVAAAAASSSAADSSAPPPSSGVTTSGGTVNALPLWTTGTNIQSSTITQTGSGATAKVGIGTAAPAATLDVKGSETVRGVFNLAATAAATTAAGKDSQPLKLTASVYNSGTGSAVNQNFLWQAEPAGNNTANANGTLNLLHAAGSNAAAETGLKIGPNGQITFAAGQIFPGTATKIGLTAPSSDFTVTGSPVSGIGTLALNWTVAPSSGTIANAIVKRDANGNFTANQIIASSATAYPLSGIYSGTSGYPGVYATSTSEGLWATGGTYGAEGDVSAGGVAGVFGNGPIGVFGNDILGSGKGVYGYSSGTGTGVVGEAVNGGWGVYGLADYDGVGVYAIGLTGVSAISGQAGSGLYASSNGGWAVNANGVDGATGVLAGSDTGYAAWFSGKVEVAGNLSKSSGSFKIDHPLDPANKYLYHSFVESPDMMNLYNGNVTTNAEGEAVVTLPDWFETLNRDFRYQLTVMGQFAQAIVSGKVANHQFAIKTDKPNVEVSWLVTGIRQDAWANAHRIPVEETKPENERGFYTHPELYGAPKEKSIMYARFPKAMEQWKETPTKAVASRKTRPPQPRP
jgi:hypothetical protein